MQYNVNMEMRMKHADAPDKFMESEVDLDEEVQRLVAVAGSPELYPELIRLGAVPLLLALLQHENADIAADAIQLFKELTDADALNDLVSLPLGACWSCMMSTSLRPAIVTFAGGTLDDESSSIPTSMPDMFA